MLLIRLHRVAMWVSIIFDDELKWTDHINHVYKKTYKSAVILKFAVWKMDKNKK